MLDWMVRFGLNLKLRVQQTLAQRTLRRVLIGFSLSLCLGMVIPVNLAFAQGIYPIPSYPDNTATPALFEQAMEASRKGNFEIAETSWTELLEQYPDNAALWSNRGNIRVGQHKLKEAVDDYNQSIALAPDQIDPYLNRGTALEGLQEWDAAIADYNHVLFIDPNNPVAYNNRGNAEAGTGHWLIALDNFQQAIKLNPKFAMARANYALALYQLGEIKTSIHEFRGLVRKYPQFADMRAALAAALWSQGQSVEAENQWVSVINLDSRYRNLDWVTQIRRWPPTMLLALEQFLNLQTQH